MKKFSFNFIFPLVFLIILVKTFSNSIFNIPPLAKLLNPYIGFVQNEIYKSKQAEKVIINNTKSNISVYYDKRKVPHIFAKNDHDMFLAQGYITAKDRLWQMDFISYVSAGRLSEIFGEKYLNYDRLQRRLGILSSAKSTLKFIESNKQTKLALDAFTKGVNEYIKNLDYKTYPFEFKLIDYKPEKWTNLKSVLIMKYVSAMLTGYEEDISMSHLLLSLGKKEFQKLYPEYSNFDFGKSKFLTSLDISNLPYVDYINYGFLNSKTKVSTSKYNPRLGSNNWAVNGFKSVSGNPLLCNDPHLGLTLPSIWYEIQLSSNSTKVYGVSIPGTIGVIIGYNEKISWGVTNGATDVRDWYKLRILNDYSAYEIDGKWKKMKITVEQIKVKNQSPFYDTIYSTIHGPIVLDKNYNDKSGVKNFALKWTLHEPSNEFLTFIQLNKSQNYQDFKKSISHYMSPIQNFIFASCSDTIAIHHQGLLYEKWNGQGRFLLDGTKSSHLYNKKISSKNLPQSFNPKSGFIYSANNYPLFDTLNFYINGYYSEQRAHNIRRILSSNKKFSINEMKRMQLNNKNEAAKIVLSEFLKILNTSKNNKNARYIINQINKWDYNYDKKSNISGFYNDWWNNFKELTWDELKIQNNLIRYPDDGVLINLILNEKNNKYFNKLNSDKVENFKDIVIESFKITLNNYKIQKWGEINKVSITHLSKLESLGKKCIKMSGHPDVLNAQSTHWGPSWRMIVEMRKRPIGYGIYVGGQSGNPGSKHYDDFINDWSKGKYYKLNFFLNEKEAKNNSKSYLIIRRK